MTDKPTPDQIQRACDLANGGSCDWTYREYGESGILTALADTIAELDEQTRAVMAIHAELIAARMENAAMQAERGKARADLGEVDRIAQAEGWHDCGGGHNAVANIVAPYRVETDPLEAHLRSIPVIKPDGSIKWDKVADEVRKFLASSELAKRGLEIGRSA